MSQNSKLFKRHLTIKFNQRLYRFTVAIIVLISGGILCYVFFKYPDSDIMETGNILVIVSIVISLIAVVVDSRANRRARIEPMIIDKPIMDEYGRMAANSFFLKIKNIGLNSARNVVINARFIDPNNVLAPFKNVDGFNSLEESRRLLRQPRYIAAGEYCEVVLFVFNYKKHNDALKRVSEASLDMTISFQDARSGVTRKTTLNIPFSQFLNTRMYLDNEEEPALKQIIVSLKQISEK